MGRRVTPAQDQPTSDRDTDATGTSGRDQEIVRLRGHIASLEHQLSALRAEHSALHEWVRGDPVAVEFVRQRSNPTTTHPGSPE